MAASGLHISISAETIAHIGGLPVTNSMLTSVIVSAILIALAAVASSQLKRTNRPTGLQNFFEFVVESLMNLVDSITGDKRKTAKFFPFVATFFLWILLNNWFGLLPGVGTIGFTETPNEAHADLLVSTTYASEEVPAPEAEAAATDHSVESVEAETGEHSDVVLEENAGAHADGETADHAEDAAHSEVFVPYLRAGTADLNTTIALALISMTMVQVNGVAFLGLSYFKKFFNFSSPIMFFVGILELISDFSKVISFAFRLFGNIFAGEVLLVVITFLTKVVVPMPFYGLELFVGFIQALVFVLLTTVFFNMATISHDEH